MPDVHRQFVVYPDRNVVFHAADTESYVFPNYVPMIRPDDVKPRTGNLLKHFSIDKGTRKTDRCHLLNSLLVPALYFVPHLIRFAFRLAVQHLPLNLEIQRSRENRLSPGGGISPDYRHLS